MVKKLNEQELNAVIDQFMINIKDKIDVDQSILYGSYAKGTAHEWSDIDLLVISKDLSQDKPKGANGFYLSQLAGFDNIYPGLEVIGVHPDKLEHPVTKCFFDEVLNTGKVVS